jgi:hypothetical protein
MRGGTRVFLEIQHFPQVSSADDIFLRSSQGDARVLRFYRSGENDSNVVIEFETLPLIDLTRGESSVAVANTIQICPLGKQDEISAPKIVFEYMPSGPGLDFVAPHEASIFGGDTILMAVSSLPVAVRVEDVTIHVGTISAQIVNLVRRKVDLQGPSSSAHLQGPRLSAATIQFVSPAQRAPGRYSVTLRSPSVIATKTDETIGYIGYRNLSKTVIINGIWPEQGSLEGGWDVWLSIGRLTTTGLEAQHFRLNNVGVKVDDIECPVMHIDRREDDTITIRLKAPPHESGAASVKV